MARFGQCDRLLDGKTSQGDVMDTTTREMNKSLGLLNSYLRTEMSAVDSYQLALESVRPPDRRLLLAECKRSHAGRVAALKLHIAEHGGTPSASSGAWGVLTQVIEGGAREIGEPTAIAVLEEFEYHDVKRYRDELGKLDPSTRRFVEVELLPQQENTYAMVRALKLEVDSLRSS
jgi:hypothetical protein